MKNKSLKQIIEESDSPNAIRIKNYIKQQNIIDMKEEPCINKKMENKFKNDYTKWNVLGTLFYPCRKTAEILPSGYYSIKWKDELGQYCLEKNDIILDDLLILPDKSFENILNDIRQFWKNKLHYEKYHYIYKRGILLYGIPGCGKSSLINLICNDLIVNQNGIILNIKNNNDIYNYREIINFTREIEPERNIITIIEDIDNFCEDHNTELTTTLLNILDGNLQTDNIVTIATTNYPEKLKERIMNRPSRFDRCYEIGKPDAVVREFYIKTKLKKDDLEKIDINEWVKKTENFTIDHLKELLLTVFVLEYDFDDAIENISEMIGTKILKNKQSNGKKIGFDGIPNK